MQFLWKTGSFQSSIPPFISQIVVKNVHEIFLEYNSARFVKYEGNVQESVDDVRITSLIESFRGYHSRISRN